ncbi:hypothetical protein BDZ89DRAFT_1060578 [Hymenopellis radicata]|nr:hypothetical protein BDZ89DRAFT_1060578 [Hymenopellis radicata]
MAGMDAFLRGMAHNMDYFGSLTTGAKSLIEAEKSGRSTEHLDFGVAAMCASCAACKAIIYCSKECSERDWNLGTALKKLGTHKEFCPINKSHMARHGETQAILTQFPWGRLETDGTFNDYVARGRFDVLGGSDYGFWSHRGGLVPHNFGTEELKTLVENETYARILTPFFATFDHLDGKDLFKEDHLSDVDGWKLETRLIAYRQFPSASKRPQIVTEFHRRISNWESWYEWRGLSKESPAALLMSFPLSAYWLVTHCLQLTRASVGRPEKRVPLHLHVIGAEVELNYLPLFSELALLLPYHDIKLVLFGPSVEKLVAIAKKSHRPSLAGKSSSSAPVFAYEAPKECGSGRIEIFLHGASSLWGPEMLSAANEYGGRPDGAIALNAGLGAHRTWVPVIQSIHRAVMPFAITEYTEHSCGIQRATFPQIVRQIYAQPMKEYPIELNPFQRPGQRGVPCFRLPNIVNGFTMVVCKPEP